ncbi:unnamed protein product [Bursaphelenchus xylophilus]|uniref:(pine wood nematode) hypothetical protein n=1 Tax=Bursaphelenchus xylophilus TaxID=6326 RepID=A0A1I7RPH5_BURXY|nr:unnamed protein product [Bursaphelenchus xylophilus]CAG9096029.1 unnamed protein product [Bursaphelenchus xylophilus]
MTDPYYCLRCSSIAIGVYNLIYCLFQFGVLGWQTHVVKTFQWEYENRQLPPTHAVDGFQARFPGLYAIYTETPERRKINALYVIVLISIGVTFVHLLTTCLLLYGVIKRNHSLICPWFFTCAPLIILTTAYAILWWSGDIFNEQLTASVAEFVFSLAINGPCFIVVLMYYLRITGSLTSDKIGKNQEKRDKNLPSDVPSFYPKMPPQPPYEMRRKLRRRESRSPLRPQSEPRRGVPIGQGYKNNQGQYPRPDFRYPGEEYRYPSPYEVRSRQQMSRADSRQPLQRLEGYNQPTQSVGRPVDTRQNRPSTRQSKRSSSRRTQSRSTSAAPYYNQQLKRRSPQRVSFSNRPRVYQRTPSDSTSNGPKLEIQTVI